MKKFKVGQKVRCIKGIKSVSGDGWEKGEIFTITKVGPRVDGDDLIWGAKNGSGVYDNWLKLVKGKPGRPAKPKPAVVKYIATGTGGLGYSHRKYTSRRLLGVGLKEEKDLSDIRVFEVKQELKVKTSFSLRKV